MDTPEARNVIGRSIVTVVYCIEPEVIRIRACYMLLSPMRGVQVKLRCAANDVDLRLIGFDISTTPEFPIKKPLISYTNTIYGYDVVILKKYCTILLWRSQDFHRGVHFISASKSGARF